MFEPERSESQHPKLQLESAGGSSGRGRRTAVGAQDGDNSSPQPLDHSGLREIPWWFYFIESRIRKNYASYFRQLPLAQAMRALKQSGVPQVYRIGLGLRWGFITPERDDFTEEDFAFIRPTQHGLRRELDAIERRSAYQLWKTSFVIPRG